MKVDEFALRPERTDGFFEELIEGVVYLSPNVKPRHNEIVRRVEKALRPLEQRGFVLVGEVACRLTDYSLPNTDAAVYRQEVWEAQDLDEFVTQAPLLAVEVHSVSNRQLNRKADLYLEHGAQQVWILYPKNKRVSIRLPDGESLEAREGETITFEGLTIPVSDLFP